MKRLFILTVAILLLAGCGARPTSASYPNSSALDLEDDSLSSRSSDSITISAQDDKSVSESSIPQASKTESEPSQPVSSSPPVQSRGGGTSSAQSEPKPDFMLEVEPASYDVYADYITVKITNLSQTERSYGLAYRIERDVNGKWEPVPLEFDVQEIAVLIPAGKANSEAFSLHQDQYEYQPGVYRIVLLDSFGIASLQFTLIDRPVPTYSVTAEPQSYPVTSDSIIVKITNTSEIDGGYGYSHRIEQKLNGKWETVPLDSNVNAIWVILPAGQTNTETPSLIQHQYDYQPGTYRIVFLDGLNGAAAEFTLY